MPRDTSKDLDDPFCGLGDPNALDELAIKHLNSKAGRDEIAANDPSEVDDEVTV